MRMSSSGRSLPWSTFIHGLSRTHKLEQPILLESVRSASSILGRVVHDQIPPVSLQQRGFHGSSTFCHGGAHAAVAVTEMTARMTSITMGSARNALKTESQANTSTSKPVQGYGSKYKSQNRERTKMEPWKIQKKALKEKFPEGWNPRKRLSPDALAGIRALNAQFPDTYTTEALSKKFKVTPEAIRRILRSTWEPTPEQELDRQDRWFRRGQSVWERKAALGIKPPRKWRMEGIVRSPGHHEQSRQISLREKEIEKEEIRRYQEQRARMQKGLPPPREW